MDTQQIANRLVELCNQGQFDACYDELFDMGARSIEAEAENRITTGMEGIKGKVEWWNATFDVLGGSVEGPWINEPHFITKFNIDTKNKQTGETAHFEELALYTVENGKIVEERFFPVLMS